MTMDHLGLLVMSATFVPEDVGKRVVNANGEEIGLVTDVDDDHAYVDPDPGLTDSIKAALGWSAQSEETITLRESDIADKGEDTVHLHQAERLGEGTETGATVDGDTGTMGTSEPGRRSNAGARAEGARDAGRFDEQGGVSDDDGTIGDDDDDGMMGDDGIIGGDDGLVGDDDEDDSPLGDEGRSVDEDRTTGTGDHTPDQHHGGRVAEHEGDGARTPDADGSVTGGTDLERDRDDDDGLIGDDDSGLIGNDDDDDGLMDHDDDDDGLLGDDDGLAGDDDDDDDDEEGLLSDEDDTSRQ